MTARYDLDYKRKWHWVAIANDGEITVSREGHERLSDCIHAVALMQASGDAAVAPSGQGSPPTTLARLQMRRIAVSQRSPITPYHGGR